MGKKIKKAFKKITKPVKKAVGALAGGGEPDVKVVEQAAPVAAPPQAQIIEPPSKDDVDTADEAQTESGKKKARAGGKKSLSVTRSSGAGLNI
ncbi:virion assembly protein [Salmonella phage vB_SalS_PC192]|uniref:Virion assembly protein n=1 Tax=Salmonella phage vB_SalM_PC127 TaxID=2961705 RepID=A0A9E7T685_9CAUD|nr:virion assembly protein [Salmonella phage vB_SalM_PC127]UVK80576.1 virion assembly protein [Salmonella phage vB_SalS_PC192]